MTHPYYTARTWEICLPEIGMNSLSRLVGVLFHYQTVNTLLTILLVQLVVVLAWTVYRLTRSGGRRGPGLNLRELQ
jgi:hypothetical protein